MRKVFATFVFLLLAAMAGLSGCKNKKTTVSNSTYDRPLVFARPSDSIDFDLARAEEGESITIGINFIERLIDFKDGSAELIPSLATSWEISKDGKTYTFHLRSKVVFHDGTPLNADAVVFNVERQWKKDHPAYSFSAPYSYWENMGMDQVLESVRKVDDLTVEFKLKYPFSPFLSAIATPFLSVESPTAILKYGKTIDQHPVGTGPYTLKTWKKDDFMELEAFPDYWGTKPKIKRVIVRVIPDNQVRLLELKKGSVHIMVYPNLSDLADIKNDPNIQVLSQPGLDIGYLAFNLKKPPLDKLEVRQAISMAIDRKRIVDELFQGYASVAKNMLPPTVMGYNSDVPQIKYDVEKAKTLLDKAGIRDLSLELWAMPVARPYNPNAKKMAEFIQADLKRVGINSKIVSYDWGTYLDKIGKGEGQVVIIGWNGDNNDPDNFLFTVWSKESALRTPTNNYAFYMNEDVNNWLKQGRTETKLELRADLYKKVQMQMYKDLPGLPINHSVVVVPIRKEVEGFALMPTGDRRFANVSFRSSP